MSDIGHFRMEVFNPSATESSCHRPLSGQTQALAALGDRSERPWLREVALELVGGAEVGGEFGSFSDSDRPDTSTH